VAKELQIPGPIERRHLVEREISATQALGYAQAYLEAGRDCDAIPFLVKADAQDELEAILHRSIERGDAFLFRSVSTATGVAPEREQWRALAEAAVAAGKELYAAEAQRMAEREED
jgi:hypothetical protein